MPPHTSHKAGTLKQQNKKHKSTSASKRSVSKNQGGRVNKAEKRPTLKAGASSSISSNRLNRLNEATVRRKQKVASLLAERRGISLLKGGGAVGGGGGSALGASDSLADYLPALGGMGGTPPKAVGILSISGGRQSSSPFGPASASLSEPAFRSRLLATHGLGPSCPIANLASFPTFKSDVVLLAPQDFMGPVQPGSDGEEEYLSAVLAMARVSSVLLVVLDGVAALFPSSGILSSSSSFSQRGGGGGGGHFSDSASVASFSSVLNPETAFDNLTTLRGERALAALKGGGVPGSVVAVLLTPPTAEGKGGRANPQAVKKKRLDELRRHTERYMQNEFGDKVKCVEDEDAAAAAPSRTGGGGAIPEGDDDDDDEEDGDNVDMKDGPTFSSLSSLAAGASAASARPLASAQATPLVRALCGAPASPPVFTSSRPYLVSDGPVPPLGASALLGGSASSQSAAYDPATRRLVIRGWLRGAGLLDAAGLMFLPGVGGGFEIERVLVLPKRAGGDSVIVTKGDRPGEPTEQFAAADALEGEQNLVGFGDDEVMDGGGESDDDGDDDDDLGDDAELPEEAWLEGVDDEEMEEGDKAADRKALNDMFNTAGGAAASKSALAAGSKGLKSGGGGGDDDAASMMYGGDDDLDMDDEMGIDADGSIDGDERRELAAERRAAAQAAAQEDDLFPDEVEIHEGDDATQRFARYRSLKSFRKSVWDPKENLPQDYATLFHFANFKATGKAVQADRRDIDMIARKVAQEEGSVSKAAGGGAAAGKASFASHVDGDGVEMFDGADYVDDEDSLSEMEVAHGGSTGGGGVARAVGLQALGDDEKELLKTHVRTNQRVEITLLGVSAEAYASMVGRHATATSLLPHENKVSVLHFNICQTSNCETLDDDGNDQPVRSKDVLTIQVGFRSWSCRPIFSQHNLNSDKHKFERFLRPGAYTAMTAYGPVTYGPCPVLVFREPRPGQSRRQLIATGSVLNADADRIVVKRAVLTGFPTRVHKRTATVKYMFFNPADVKWFKPAGLTTKHGLQGHIIDSIGTHGAMKCLFNAPIKQHDTVCLSLFKRIYPKYDLIGNGDSAAAASDARSVSGRSVRGGGRPTIVIK